MEREREREREGERGWGREGEGGWGRERGRLSRGRRRGGEREKERGGDQGRNQRVKREMEVEEGEMCQRPTFPKVNKHSILVHVLLLPEAHHGTHLVQYVVDSLQTEQRSSPHSGMRGEHAERVRGWHEQPRSLPWSGLSHGAGLDSDCLPRASWKVYHFLFGVPASLVENIKGSGA